MDAGLPQHVVHMYLEQSNERLNQRMKNMIKTALPAPNFAALFGMV